MGKDAKAGDVDQDPGDLVVDDVTLSPGVEVVSCEIGGEVDELPEH